MTGTPLLILHDLMLPSLLLLTARCHISLEPAVEGLFKVELFALSPKIYDYLEFHKTPQPLPFRNMSKKI